MGDQSVRRGRRHGARRRALVAVAAASLALLAGCSSDDSGDPSASNERPSSSPSATSSAASPSAGGSSSAQPVDGPLKGLRYVALGDSYSAAPGVGQPTGPDGCFQTDANYAHLLAARYGLELTDVTCSSATSENLTKAQALNAPPQLDALSADTDVVTLGMGGNDEGLFSGLVTGCGRLGFGGGGASRPADQRCADTPRFAEPALTRELQRLTQRISADVRLIRERAPKARIVVVGYPQVVPASGGCERLPIDAADLPFAHDLNRRLDAAVRRGARAADALVADVWTATRGHDVCAADPWIAGVVPEGPAVPLHPYAAYEQAVSDLVADLLT